LADDSVAGPPTPKSFWMPKPKPYTTMRIFPADSCRTRNFVVHRIGFLVSAFGSLSRRRQWAFKRLAYFKHSSLAGIILNDCHSNMRHLLANGTIPISNPILR